MGSKARMRVITRKRKMRQRRMEENDGEKNEERKGGRESSR